MAMQLDAGKYSRSEVFLIDPRELVIDHAANARDEPHSDADVRSMANSILANGQLQNALGRRVQGNKVQLALGYRRAAAVRLINEAPESFPAELRPKKLPVLLRVAIQDMNDEEAFVRSIEENRERKDASVLDDIHNQRVLRETYDWTDDQIAEKYGVTVSYLGRLRKILQLPKEVQRAITKGVLGVRAAMDLADLSKEVRAALFQRIKDESAKLDADLERARFEAMPPDAPVGTANPQATDADPGASSPGRKAVDEVVPEANGHAPPTKKGAAKGAKKQAPAPKQAAKKAAKVIAKEVEKATRTEKAAKGSSRSLTMAEAREFFEGLTGPAEPALLKEFAEVALNFLAGKEPAEAFEKWLRTVFPVK
jgi:ParB/RepB/Spo0J family partition protein